MPNCAILGSPDEGQEPEKLTGLASLQHSVIHLQHDLAVATQTHRVVQPSIRSCSLVE